MAIQPSIRRLRPLARGLFTRVFTACWLLLQVTVVGAVPLVDAQAGHAGRVVAHWEDASDTTCPPMHDTGDCQLCQQVTVVGTGASARNLLPPPNPVAQAPTPDAQTRVPRPVVTGAHSTRAPPIS